MTTCAICCQTIHPEPRFYTATGQPRHMLCNSTDKENTMRHAFHGNTATGTGDFVIDTDRPLEDGPCVLTCTLVDPTGDDCFQGFWGAAAGSSAGKFVEVPQRLVAALVACIDVATEDEDAAGNLGIDLNDVEEVNAFRRALQRCAPAPLEVPAGCTGYVAYADAEGHSIQHGLGASCPVHFPVDVPDKVGSYEIMLGHAGWGVRDVRNGEFVADAIETSDKALKHAEWLAQEESYGITAGREWQIINPDGSVDFTVRAMDEIDALDRWADSMEMQRYSDVIKQDILEDMGGPGVYRLEDGLHAIHSNYEVVVVPAPDPAVVAVLEAPEPATTVDRKWLVARFDVTELSEDEVDALTGEVFAQGDRSEDHPSVEVEIS